MTSQPPPISPTAASDSSHSLITSLDRLSFSTSSSAFDIVSHPPASASGTNRESFDSVTSGPSSHSRQTSTGSHVSRPDSLGPAGSSQSQAGRGSESEDYEVILHPRSLAATATGTSTGSVPAPRSAMGTPGRRGFASPTPHQVKPGPASSAAGGRAPIQELTWQQLQTMQQFSRRSSDTGAQDGTEADGEAGRVGAEMEEYRQAEIRARHAAKQRRKRAAKAEAKAAARESGSQQLHSGPSVPASASVSGASDTGSSFHHVSQDSTGDGDIVGKGKGKKVKRAGGKAKRRAENKDLGNVESALDALETPAPSLTPKRESTTYRISGQSRKVDRETLELLTGKKEDPVPVPSPKVGTPKGTPISREALRKLEAGGEGSGSAASSDSDEEDEEEGNGEEEDDEAEEEEVDALTDLGTPEVFTDVDGSIPASSSARRRVAGSIISASDARSSIDDFLQNPGHQMSKEETLRFWQSLCYELGLADLDETPSLPDLSSESSNTSSRSLTPTQLRPMPQTLFKAKALLKSEGHVNIADYFDARTAAAEAKAKAGAKAGSSADSSSGGSVSDSTEDGGAGRYAHLVQPSASSMRRYTKSSGRFVNLDLVKAEVMQPLLRDFGFKRARESREGVFE